MMDKLQKCGLLNRRTIFALIFGGSLFLFGFVIIVNYVMLDGWHEITPGLALATLTAFFIMISPLHPRLLGLVATVLAVLLVLMGVYVYRHSPGDLLWALVYASLLLIPAGYVFLLAVLNRGE
jgi:hypothetical protein